MDGHEWQVRARNAGLSQKSLARLAGKPENTISRQLREHFGEVPGYLVALIVAWECMTPEARSEWISRVDRELARLARQPAS